MKTKGELENLVCRSITQITHGNLGQGPKTIECKILDDIILVRIFNKIKDLERKISINNNILKEYRCALLMNLKDSFKEMIRSIFDIELNNFYHDMNMCSGEEFLIFTLESPVEKKVRISRISKGIYTNKDC